MSYSYRKKSRLDRIREDYIFSIAASKRRNSQSRESPPPQDLDAPPQNDFYFDEQNYGYDEAMEVQEEEEMQDTANDQNNEDDDSESDEDLPQEEEPIQQQQQQLQEQEQQQGNLPNHLAAYRHVAEEVTTEGSFKLNAYIDILHRLRAHRILPEDANTAFMPNSEHSKESAAAIISDFCYAASLNEKEEKLLLEMLDSLLPEGTELPFHRTKRENIVNDIDKYTREDSHRCLVYDCCPCGQCVYTNDCKDLYICTEGDNCSYKYRYTPCKVCKALEACDHPSARVAQCVTHYIPFTGIVFDLLAEPGFHAALNYEDWDKDMNEITDVHYGKSYRTEMDAMHAKFRQEQLKDDSIIEISLALAVYFDGSKVFSRRTTTFIPLVVSILNLPPEYRSVLGVGCFTLSICTFKDGAFNQDFILKDCFVNEMVGCCEGVYMEVDGRRYFVQARIVLHGYDTRALQPMLKVRMESKKLVRCPLCNTVNNYLTGHFPKLGVYEGHRRLLPLEHYYRIYGQSRQCCPQGQYQCDDLLVDNSLLVQTAVFHSSTDIMPLSLVLHHRGGTDARKALESCSPEYQAGGVHRQTWTNFKTQYIEDTKSDVEFKWFHAVPVNRPVFLSEHIYYPFCDYRLKIDYERISNDQYKEDANEALRTIKDSNGVYGTWPYARLPYANVTLQVCWCSFHCLLNVAKYILVTWKGERKISGEAVNYCRQSATHPYFYTAAAMGGGNKRKRSGKKKKGSSSSQDDDDCQSPYVLRKQVRGRIEDYVDLIHIPKNHSEHYQVKRIFTGSSELHGVAKIQVVTVLMEFIIWLLRKLDRDYPTAYIVFHLMLAEDLQFIQRLSFSSDDIERLKNLIVETVETHTALYPPTESKIIWHQLVDIVHFIDTAGPLRGWWTLPMERALCKIKRSVPAGGRSYYITTFRRHMKQEQHKLFQSYDMSEKTLSDKTKRKQTALYGALSNGTCFIDQGKLCFSDKAIRLSKRDRTVTEAYVLTSMEYNILLNHLHEEVLRLCGNDKIKALRNSCLARLFALFKLHREKSCTRTKNILEWMLNVETVMNTNSLVIVNGDPSRCREKLLRRMLFEEGHMFLCDFNQLRTFWRTYQFEVIPYKEAIIYGVSFSSRGWLFSENGEVGQRAPRYGAETHKHAVKECNLLRKNLMKNEYSTWFSEAEPSLAAGEQRTHTSPYAGQFNYFFRLMIPDGHLNDPLINGMPLGSAVMRRTERIHITVSARLETTTIWTQMLTVDAALNTDESYYPDKRFVSLTNVHATVYGVCFLSQSKHGFPVSAMEIMLNPDDLQKILLIPLYPSRATSVKFKESKRELIYHNPSLDDDGDDDDD